VEKADSIYTDLQKHLDKQAVGFPATRSGVEIRILKELFTPEQAKLALYINYKPQSAQEIYNQAKGSGISLKKVKDLLAAMESTGAIGGMEKDRKDHYYTMPLLVGIVEQHASKATPQFFMDFNHYMAEGYGRAFASTKVSQMRTVPIEQSLKVEHHVATYDEIREIIKTTPGPIAINPCMCREGAKRRGQPCHVTTRTETCMSFGDWAQRGINAGNKEISREEALEIMRKNEEDGLVLQPTNYQKIDFICSCCGDCCGVMRIQKALPKPAINWSHNFFAAIDTDICSGCGVCVERCQMNAIKLDEQSGLSTVNLDRCIGCGNCVASCPSEALKLVKKEKEIAPPEDRTGLYKLLAERK
jgi:NAD-dependent dihydropyrimidine dehydrogenase PreA subunit